MKRELALLLSVNALFLGLRYLYILLYPIDLAPDEALYWEYSRRPDISYYSKPPLVGYLILVSTALLGDTELGIRFFAPLLTFLSSLFLYRFAKDIGLSETRALVAGTLPNFLIGPSMNAVLMTIDAPFIFFYSLSLWLLHRAITTNKARWWVLGSISSALALLSKYTAVFIVPTLLIFKPALIRSKRFWLMVAILSLAFLPVLVWNLKNDLVGFKHLWFLAGAREKGDFTITLKYLPEFLGGQIAILSAVPFFFMLYGFWKALKGKNREDLYLTSAVLPVLTFFLLMSLKTRVYANWSAFPYMAGILLAVKYMPKRWIALSYIVGFLTLLPMYFSILPPHLDMKKRIVGWEELGKAVSAIYDREKDFIITPRYQLSAELAFYVDGKPFTYSINLGRRMNDYDLWKDDLPLQKGKDAIFVTYGSLDQRVSDAFKEVIYEGEFTYRYRSAVIRRLKIYKLREFSGRIEEEGFSAY